jgi:hypothetical protein
MIATLQRDVFSLSNSMMLSTMVVLLMMSLLESSGAPPRLIRKESMSVVLGDIADEGATLIQRTAVSVSDKIKSAFFSVQIKISLDIRLGQNTNLQIWGRGV